MEDTEKKYRSFVMRGRVYSGNESHAAHTVYWAHANGEAAGDILIDDIQITEEEK